MRLGQFTADGTADSWVGLIDGSDVIDLPRCGEDINIDVPQTLGDLLGEWGWESKLELLQEYSEETDAHRVSRDDVIPVAPIPDPQKIVCVGLNYTDHAEEGGNPIPEEPVLFAKFPSAINAPGEPIRWSDAVTSKVDYEGELVIVIGESAKNIEPKEAESVIAGYTIGNDVSARDLQHGDGQWVRGKSLDTFCPIGPELVTSEEIEDVNDLTIRTEVNGELRQDSTTANLIFPPHELVSFISQVITLSPGDIVFTGTPPGVGVYREPPVFLSDGDKVTVEIDEIGQLTNHCEVN